MANLIYALATRWVSRWARPEPHALAEIEALSPAVVITGGSRGIGAALARRFAEARTHEILIIAREPSSLSETQAAIETETGAKVHALTLDVTREDTPAVIEAALAERGLYLDYLVNNAGIGLAGRFEDGSPDDVMRLVSTNVVALTRLTHHALPKLKSRGRGGILNIASLGGLVPGPHQATYYASKAFVVSLTEAVAFEMRGTGVRVAVVAPGPVETDFHREMGAERSLYRLVLPSRSPDMVARSAYRGLMLGRTLIVPGLFETLNAALVRVLPHTLTLPLIAALLYKRKSDPTA